MPRLAGHPVRRMAKCKNELANAGRSNTGLPAFAGNDSIVWGRTTRSNDQISSEPRQFLIPAAVAFFASHHMMTIIFPIVPREFSSWPKPSIPS